MLRHYNEIGLLIPEQVDELIIDKETFDKAEEIRMSRAKALGRVWELEEKKDILFPTNFTMPAVKKVSDDPFEQAAYAYSLIESEVDGDGAK